MRWALAAGQADAAFADRRVQPLRQRRRELRHPGLGGGAVDRGIVGVGPAQADVVAQRAVEQHRRLADPGDAAAQILGVDRGQVCAVDQDAAAVRAAEAQQQ
jgi:hypothetical protein